MKKGTILYVIGLLLASMGLIAQDGNYKVFPFKSAIVEYKQEGNANGTHTKYIEKYGYLQADYSMTETTVFGFTNKEKSGTILKGPKVYSINYKSESVSVGVNPTYESYANSNGADYDELGRNAMASLGFSNTNKTETIAGKKCEIWKGSLGRIWVWKSLSLKSETSVLGISIIETAVSVKLNASVPSSKFKTPSGFKTEEVNLYGSENGMEGMESMEGMFGGGSYEMSAEDKKAMNQVANMSYSDFRKMMKDEDPEASEEEIKQAYTMTKEMVKRMK